jgi:hypothetical protein
MRRFAVPPSLVVLAPISLVAIVALSVGQSPVAAAWPRPPRPVESTPAPLDDETLGRLVIFAFAPGEEPAVVPVGSLDGGLQTQPGGSLALTLGVYECCYFFEPVAVSARWSVVPEGAHIDATTGLLTIEPTTVNGSVFHVRAEVEGGRRIVEAEVAVFTPAANPLVGLWREEAQLACTTGAEVVPAQPIEEIVFNADGTFTVTWLPFEVYTDYWGVYEFDLARGTLELTVEGGNYVPPEVDGSGRFALDAGGRLVLTEIWLGSPQGGGPTNCGHILAG